MQTGSTIDLIDRLTQYLNRGRFNTITDELIARHLVRFFELRLADGRIDNYEGGTMITHALPLYFQDAFDELRTSKDSEVVRYRKEYESITRHDVPNLVEVAGNNVQRYLMISNLSNLVRHIYGPEGTSWITMNIEKYLHAQDEVLSQHVHQFAVKCWQTGLGEMLEKSRYAAFSGLIGTTILRSFITAGRVMVTFARKNATSIYLGDEDSVSLVGEDGEKEGVRFGVQSVFTDFSTACTLIAAVTSHWPESPDKVAKVFKPDEKVAIA